MNQNILNQELYYDDIRDDSMISPASSNRQEQQQASINVTSYLD